MLQIEALVLGNKLLLAARAAALMLIALLGAVFAIPRTRPAPLADKSAHRPGQPIEGTVNDLVLGVDGANLDVAADSGVWRLPFSQ